MEILEFADNKHAYCVKLSPITERFTKRAATVMEFKRKFDDNRQYLWSAMIARENNIKLNIHTIFIETLRAF